MPSAPTTVVVSSKAWRSTSRPGGSMNTTLYGPSSRMSVKECATSARCASCQCRVGSARSRSACGRVCSPRSASIPHPPSTHTSTPADTEQTDDLQHVGTRTRRCAIGSSTHRPQDMGRRRRSVTSGAVAEGGERCFRFARDPVAVGCRSMVEPVQWMVPSGRVQVAVRSGVMVRVQPPSWMRWWCLSQTGRRLSMSVGPSSRPHQRMWWMSQAENTTVQSGWAQVRCIARNARRWARVAVRRVRPTSRTSPAPFKHDRQDLGVTTHPSHRLDR